MSEYRSGPSVVPVQCGHAEGMMHLNLFTCPGIHQYCIEVNGRLLSPKQFTILGDKEKQKDWKASIRIGRSCLRYKMEISEIVFFDHSRQCSGKCQSRNYLTNSQVNRGMMPEGFVDMTKSNSAGGIVIEEKKARGRPRGSCNYRTKDREATSILAKLQQLPFPPSLFDDGDDQEEEEDTVPEGCTPFSEILQCLQYDPQHFWSQMHSAGLIAHFCDDIIASAINMKQVVMRSAPISDTLAEMMTRTVFSLNAQQTVLSRVRMSEVYFAAAKRRRKSEARMCEFLEGSKVSMDVEEIEVPTDDIYREEVVEEEVIETREEAEEDRPLFDTSEL